jgi:16S rRNA (guanine1207-N2)-methyltransferase
MTEDGHAGLYGVPPADLADVAAEALQFSPLSPGAHTLEERRAGTLASMVMLAPPGVVERHYAVAQALRLLPPGAPLTVMAPKLKGGARLRRELEAFGCAVTETARRHHRICICKRPAAVTGLEEALANGGPRFIDDLGFWSQPGVFSWDRVDPGTALLVKHLPALAGRGADFGSGFGYLSRAVLASPKVTSLTSIDIDRRAVEATKRNIDDPRASMRWADLRASDVGLEALDFVVMNPPFHDGGDEDKALGQSFIRRAAEVLRPGGVCWLTANRHLPYENVLKPFFKRNTLKAEATGYKVYEAVR